MKFKKKLMSNIALAFMCSAKITTKQQTDKKHLQNVQQEKSFISACLFSRNCLCLGSCIRDFDKKHHLGDTLFKHRILNEMYLSRQKRTKKLAWSVIFLLFFYGK